MANKLEQLLNNFDKNQLNEINKFLNSSQGAKIKNKINSANKDELMREFQKIDPSVVKSKMKGISSKDIMQIINKL